MFLTFLACELGGYIRGVIMNVGRGWVDGWVCEMASMINEIGLRISVGLN